MMTWQTYMYLRLLFSVASRGLGFDYSCTLMVKTEIYGFDRNLLNLIQTHSSNHIIYFKLVIIVVSTVSHFMANQKWR